MPSTMIVRQQASLYYWLWRLLSSFLLILSATVSPFAFRLLGTTTASIIPRHGSSQCYNCNIHIDTPPLGIRRQFVRCEPSPSFGRGLTLSLLDKSGDGNDESVVPLGAKVDDDEDDDNKKHGNELTIVGVTLKLAFDGAWGVADLSEQKSERFTCEESLDMVHRVRRDSHAVLVGRTTVERDDCTLTVRRGVQPRSDIGQPVRVIVDPQLALDLSSYRIFQDGLRTLVFHCNAERSEAFDLNATSSTTTLKAFPNVSLIYLPSKKDTGPEIGPHEARQKRLVLSPLDICRHLDQEYQLHHIMVEGGPRTAELFLQEAGLVDRAILVFAPFCFREPLASNMTRSTFQNAGLELVYEGQQGVDYVEHWSRPNQPWPTTNNNDLLWP